MPTCSLNSPFSRCGIPQAKSTTSIPLCNEPAASISTLPCSKVINSVSSSRWLSRSSLNLNITCARLVIEVFDQERYAASAATTAFSRSLLLPIGNFEITSPLAGLKISPKRSELDDSREPLIQCSIIFGSMS